ncbi:MFS transporter [Actinacidiphila paucisporea]|uniref:MFS transporter n=1 Tax=Actinacidiphila paucisporea TaxID=310782 RepID=UPI0038991C52
MRPVRGAGSPWRCLRHSGMRWWSAANLVSNIGTWMQMTVQNLLVLQITHSAAMTGLSIAAQAAPGLLLGPLGGALVDSWPRRRVAAVSQAALALVAFVTAVLVGGHMLGVGALLGLAVVTGLIATLDGPACALLGNDLVPERDVPSAIALGSVVSSAGRLAGVALAGVVVALSGPAAAYAANGVSFLCVAAVIPFLRPLPKASAACIAEAPTREPAPAGGTRQGLRYFRNNPRLMRLAGITALSSVFGRNYTLTLAVLVTGPLHRGPAAFGAVSTALALGGVAGAVLAGRLRRASVGIVGTLAAVGALMQVAAGLAPTVPALIVLVVPMAVAESVSDTAGASVLLTHPPAALRGRVLGVWRSASTVWTLAGPPLLGLMLEYAGARGALVCGGLLIAGGIAAGSLRQDRAAVRGHLRAVVPARLRRADPVVPELTPVA